MLPKNQRVERKPIKQIFEQGRFLNGSSLTLKFTRDPKAKKAKISFIAPKSVAKTAVERNSLRRKGYRAIKPHMSSLPNDLSGVFIFKKKEINILDLENEISVLLSKVT
jgi:ribonuclease P protein component